MSQISLCGADTLVCETLEARANQTKVNAILAPMIRSFTLLVAALREIFDESAYDRFLARSQVTSSPTAYNNFLREGEIAKARRPRCC
jgi:hypothetical protein